MTRTSHRIRTSLTAGPAWAGPLRVPATAAVPGGGTALLMIRPTGVALSYDLDGDQHLTGVVADVAFRGRGYEHAVDIPGHGRLAGVLGPLRAARGSRVGLRLEAAGCHLFPVPGAPAVPAAAGQSRPP
jgi:iron(III) transport system ATP-binding protein